MPWILNKNARRLKKYNVFVSYKREDDDARAILIHALEEAGFDVWWDAKLRVGNFRRQIREKIRDSDIVIGMWSQNASSSPAEVIFEVGQAVALSKLLPIYLDKAPTSGPLSGQHCFNFDQWEHAGQARHNQIYKIIEEVKRLANLPEHIPGVGTAPNIKVHLSEGFPGAPRKLVGRGAEMQVLRNAWQDEASNAVVLHALGGAGKSALLRTFANERLENEGDGAARIYAWSAYSQGSGEQQHADTDTFITNALNWFGYEGPPIRDSVERALTLAKLIQQQLTLLLLDGLEPLQHPLGGRNGGKLKDRSMAALIKALGNVNPGLLVITSRQPVLELKGMGNLVVDQPLDQLSPSAGADLLVELGVRGRQQDLQAAVGEVNGHALSVTLLGTYIAEVCGGDIRKRQQFQLSKIIDTPEELEAADETQRAAKRTRRIIEEYLKQFESLSGKTAGNGGPERALLNLVGLFDRPADSKAVEMLLSEHIPGLTDELFFDEVVKREGMFKRKKVTMQEVNPRERGQRIRRALERLGKLHLIDKVPPNDPRQLDAHPIIRAYFTEKNVETAPKATQMAHEKLYHHYKNLGSKKPETLADMQPLLHAIGHGVRAGNALEAFEMFRTQILKGHNFLGRVLGAHETMLAAAAEFYVKPWSTPHPDLPRGAQAWLLNLSATALMSTGRLKDAIEPREEGLEMYKNLKNWRRAAYSASRLSTTLLITGQVNHAIEVAKNALKYAEESNDFEQRVLRRSELSAALNASGDLPSAMEVILEAEKLLETEEAYKGTQQLYSLPGYRYGYLLLHSGHCKQALSRGRHILKKAQELEKDGLGSQDVGFGWLLIGRALDALNDRSLHAEASRALNSAVECMRQADTEQYIPPTLIARARHHRHRVMNGETQFIEPMLNDLQQAEDTAQPEMQIYLADLAIERAHLAADGLINDGKNAKNKALKELAKASKIINETGYYGRNSEISKLRAQIDSIST